MLSLNTVRLILINTGIVCLQVSSYKHFGSPIQQRTNLQQLALSSSSTPNPRTKLRSIAAGLIISLFPFSRLGLDSFSQPEVIPKAVAADQWNDYNRLAADTWRVVDELFLDRTFNNADWFQLRQQIVKKNYKSDEEVFEAIKNMMSKLGDKYTRYLTPAQYGALMNSAVGELTGMGLELEAQSAGDKSSKSVTVVVRTEDGSPAQLAGVLRGDIIVNMDGTPADNLTPEEIAALARGKIDSKASLRVKRGEESIDFAVVRKPIKIQAVSSGQFSISGGKVKDVGYVKIRSFATSTRDEVMHALEGMHAKNKGDPLDALVIDLRGNSGGSLQGAIETSSLVLNPGKIVVFVVGKDGNEQGQQTLPNGVPSSDPDLPDTRTPLYLLVDAETASAAEVFAAALKENERATLVGEKTFGKGIIQNLQELRKGGVAVTVAKYETPLHNNINKVGINVDTKLHCDRSITTEACATKIFSQ